MAKATQKSGRSWKSNNKGKDNESNDSKKSDNDNQNKSTSQKFCPHSANSQQSVTHDAVKDHTTNKTQQQCNQGMDTVKSLRDLHEIDMDAKEPQRAITTEADKAKATVEQESFNIECKIELQEHAK